MKVIQVGDTCYDTFSESTVLIESEIRSGYADGTFFYRVDNEPFIRSCEVQEAYRRFIVLDQQQASVDFKSLKEDLRRCGSNESRAKLIAEIANDAHRFPVGIDGLSCKSMLQ